MSGRVVLPGDVISELPAQGGMGTYIFDDQIRAAVIGALAIEGNKVSVSVSNIGPKCPKVDDIVTCRVLRINQRQCTLAILLCNGQPCPEGYLGIVR